MVYILGDSAKSDHFKHGVKCGYRNCEDDWEVYIPLYSGGYYFLCSDHFEDWKQKHPDLGEFFHHVLLYTEVFLSRDKDYIQKKFDEMREMDWYYKPIAILRKNMKLIKETKEFQYYGYIIPKEHYINLINRDDVIISEGTDIEFLEQMQKK